MPIRDGSPPPPGFPPEAETGKFSIVVKKQREAYSPARPSTSSTFSSPNRPGSSGSLRSSSSSSSSSSRSFLQKLKKKAGSGKKKREESLLRDDITGYAKVGSGSGSRSDERKKNGNSYENWARESPSMEDMLRVFPGNALSDEEDGHGESERGRKR